MRLIDARTLELRDIIDPWQYAILSHTWGDEEVSFKDMASSRRAKRMKGYRKIRFACDQAVKDGFNYVWCDTCCIDKSSSAELSEAINAMWLYYRDSAVCYAYLEDYAVLHSSSTYVTAKDIESDQRYFSRSRWFTRGWTLQELIAPAKVTFYDKNWTRIGARHDPSLLHLIHDVTKIPEIVLRDSAPVHLSRYSIAARMSWAATRKCTRIEDEAYSLLGIFDVNMPMLYGEGNRAFRRLQEEIIKTSTDHSFLAYNRLAPGLFAMNPFDFRQGGSIDACSISEPMESFSMTNRGLLITLPVAQDFSTFGAPHQVLEVLVVALNCDREGEAVALRLLKMTKSQTDSHLPSEYRVVYGLGNETIKNLEPDVERRTIILRR